MDLTKYRFYLVFVIVLISTDSSAQLLDTNTIWSERGEKYSYVLDDTVTMNNKLYHQINRYSDTTITYSNNSNGTFLLRVHGDSILRYDQFRDEDVLIYDFSMEIDDSVFVYPQPDMVNDSVLLRCENVDTVSVMGIQRRRLTMRTLNPEPYYQNDIEYWYWGIGSDLGLLQSGRQGIPMTLDSYAPLLYCCHKGFDQVYQTSFSNKCYNTAYIKDYEISEIINLYPNPINSGQKLTIQSENTKINMVNIFDISGKRIYQSSFGGESQLSIRRSFRSGIYFVFLYDDNNVVSCKKLLVN